MKGMVPIPSDLAKALRKHSVHLGADDPVFCLPTTSGSIVDMLRKDLEGAGIPWRLPGGEVIDFHTLRSTAITWWLTEDGLLPRVVQHLARLRSLPMVQNYSRNFNMENFSWLNRGPTLVAHRKRRKAG
jgi:integrase